MQQLSTRYGVSFLVVNQVSDVVNRRHGDADHAGGSAGGARHVAPAMGLTWSNCVNTRLMLSRCVVPRALINGSEIDGASTDANAVLRELHVIFSPCVPPARVAFAVLADRVQGMDVV